MVFSILLLIFVYAMYNYDLETKQEYLVTLLEEFLGEPRKHYETKGQISFDCPACSYEKGVEFDGKGNLEINYALGVYNCWACAETNDTKGKLYYLFKEHASHATTKKFLQAKFTFDKDYYDEEEVEKVEEDALKLPQEFYLLHGKQKNEIFNSAFVYLYGRGITDDIIEKYKIGFCLDGKYQNRIIIPSYDADGDLNYFIARSIGRFTHTKFKYLNPDIEKTSIIFNELLIDWEKPVFLVEGAFDHIVVPNSIPLLGKKMYDKLFTDLYFKSKNLIIIVLDDDAYGDAVKIFNKLDAGKLRGRILLNKMPKDHDLSSFNENFGQANLKEWLRNKNIKLND